MSADFSHVDEREECETEVSLDTTFDFPKVMIERVIQGVHLIIAPEQANWLVVNDQEYNAFCLFKEGRSIQEVEDSLGVQGMDASAARTVVSSFLGQVFGKEFLQDAEISEEPSFQTASVFLTAGCNLRCTLCLWGATVPEPNECSLAHWQNFLSAFKNFGGETIVLTGGEPMISSDCFDFIRFGKRLGLKIRMLSNGTLVTSENACFLGNHCSEIRLSVDGPNAETHESIRGTGTFAKVIFALRELSKYPDCRLSVSMTATPETLPVFQTELGSFIRWVKGEINRNIDFQVTQKLMPGRQLACLSKPDERKFKTSIHALCNDQIEPGFVYKLEADAIIPNRRVFGCGLAKSFVVRPNGDVWPCGLFPDVVCNIKQMVGGRSFMLDLSSKMQQLSRSTSVDSMRPCGSCELRYFCGGKCRKDNHVDCGDLSVCECSETYRQEWYEKLVCINPYLVEPITDP